VAFKNTVKLTPDQVSELTGFVSRGKHSVQLVIRARILLLVNQGDLTDKQVAEKVNCS
jgi:hypothetical protein